MNKVEICIKNTIFQLVVGDIAEQETEAVVNAANKGLAPGGGVAGAVHRVAGLKLWEECKKLGECKTGQAKITGAYNLPNKYVIHTVGPVYSGIEEDAELLKKSYLNSLKLAEENNIESVTFPALSTGAFGYPVEEAAKVAIKTIIEYLKGNTNIKLIRMVLYGDKSFDVHKKILEGMHE